MRARALPVRIAALLVPLLASGVLAGALAARPAFAAEDATDAAGERRIKISWGSYEGAVKYQLQLSDKAAMDPVLTDQFFEGTRASLPLKPGVYYFRVRAVDSKGGLGPWSEVDGFVVYPTLPKLLEPRDQQSFKDKLAGNLMRFRWDGGSEGQTYVIELTDQGGSVYRHSIDRPSGEYDWPRFAPGRYKVRIGTQSATGDHWGDPVSFGVEESASSSASGEMAVEEREQEWWGIARLAQAVVVYNANDQDTGVQGTGAALAALVSAELRWRQAKASEQDWTFSGSLNFEMIHQSVLDADFYLPRGYARAFVGREFGQWRLGPFLQAGAGESGLFVVEGPTDVIAAKVFRENVGVGGVATYRPAPSIVLSLLALARMDTGGVAAGLPNPLSASPAFEAGFGGAVNVGPKVMLEGRLRVLQESFDWAPASGGSDSSLNDLFLIFDFGVGMRF